MDSCWRLCAEEIYREIKIHFLTHVSCILLLSAETSLSSSSVLVDGGRPAVSTSRRDSIALDWSCLHGGPLTSPDSVTQMRGMFLPPFPLFKPLGRPPFVTIFVVHIQDLNVYPQINASSLLSFLSPSSPSPPLSISLSGSIPSFICTLIFSRKSDGPRGPTGSCSRLC